MADAHERATQLADLAELIMSVSRRLNAVIRNDPATVHLSSLERLVIRCITQEPGTTPTHIANLVDLKSSNTSAALRSLTKRGFIRRETDPIDGRSVHLYPTDAALANLDRVRAQWTRMLEPHLPEDADVESAVALLEKLDLSLNQG